MQLFADWCEEERSVPPIVLIVDHALRDGSKEEAAKVKIWARAKGFDAHILSWKGRKPVSGIEGKAPSATPAKAEPKPKKQAAQ